MANNQQIKLNLPKYAKITNQDDWETTIQLYGATDKSGAVYFDQNGPLVWELDIPNGESELAKESFLEYVEARLNGWLLNVDSNGYEICAKCGRLGDTSFNRSPKGWAVKIRIGKFQESDLEEVLCDDCTCDHLQTRRVYEQRPPSEGRKLVAVGYKCEVCKELFS